MSLNDGIQTSFMVDHIKQKAYKRIGLMHDSTGGGSLVVTRPASLKDNSLTFVAGPEVFDQNDTDMTAQLTKMKDAKVDFIISYSLAPAGADRQSMQKIACRCRGPRPGP